MKYLFEERKKEKNKTLLSVIYNLAEKHAKVAHK